MSEITVCVVVPIYNCKLYIEQAIDSIVNQPRIVNNIILVDDGSTDGSAELCDKLVLKFPNIHLIHQQNYGVSVARNKGISLSHETYIVYSLKCK